MAQFVGSSGSRGLQLGVQLAIWRGGRGRQHQRFERRHLRLQDVNLGGRDVREQSSPLSRRNFCHGQNPKSRGLND